VREPIENEVGADEPGAAGDKNRISARQFNAPTVTARVLRHGCESIFVRMEGTYYIGMKPDQHPKPGNLAVSHLQHR